MRHLLGLPVKRSKLSVIQVRHAARVHSSVRRAGAVSVLATYVTDTTIALTEPTRRAARAPKVQVGTLKNESTALRGRRESIKYCGDVFNIVFIFN